MSAVSQFSDESSSLPRMYVFRLSLGLRGYIADDTLLSAMNKCTNDLRILIRRKSNYSDNTDLNEFFHHGTQYKVMYRDSRFNSL